MKHSYQPECECHRCQHERGRRQAQATNRPIAHVMLDWAASRNRRRARIARNYWDDFESGRPMSSDDY